MPEHRVDHTPRFFATVRFAAEASARYGAALPELPDEEILMDFRFDVRHFSLEPFFRYARPKASATRRVFSDMEFLPDPPGERVGPWPGWRGIPPMPPAVLRRGDARAEIRFQFRGEEERTGTLRALCTLPPGEGPRVDVDSGHPALVPLSADLYATSRPRARPRPVRLRQELRGTHPRILVTPGDLHALRARAPGSSAWAETLRLLQVWDLPPELTPESKTLPGPERLRGEDRVVIAAMMALIDPSPENVRRGRESFLGFCAETSSPDYEPLRIDTQSGETLFVLALGYDWLCEHLTPPEREDARRWIFEVASVCWSYLGYERRDYAQAHYLGCALGIIACAFLFWEEHPRAQEWAAYFAGVLTTVVAMLPADGFYPHGINLWVYEYGFLLRWLELFRVAAGLDLWSATDHWAGASRFRASVTSHDGLCAMTFGDPQYRVSGDAWMHLLIGARTGDREALALGARLAGVSHEGVDFRSTPPRRRVMEFLYEPPAGAAPPPPAAAVFRDGTQVALRTDRTLFCFRAGPPLGWARYRGGEFGAYGHGDPADGAFLLLWRGAPVVCGPGPVYRRDTAHHSLPTVDGTGQVGHGCVWLPDFYAPGELPPLPGIMLADGRLAVASELGTAYLRSAGIRSADRALYVAPDELIVGADRISCDRARAVSWHLASRFPIEERDGMFRLGPPEAAVRLRILSPVPVRWDVSTVPVVPGYTHDGEPLFLLSSRFEGASVEIVWCLEFGERGLEFESGHRWSLVRRGSPAVRRHDRWIYPEGFDAHPV